MSVQVIQMLQIMGVSLCACVLVLLLARKQLLSFRYAMGWILLSVSSFVGALAIPFIEPISELLRIGPFVVVGSVCLIVLLGICVQLSISISGMQRHISTLNEEIAILRNIVEKSDAH
jgi:hypothetical protein